MGCNLSAATHRRNDKLSSLNNEKKIYVAGFTVRKSEANPIDQYRMYRRRNPEDAYNHFCGMPLHYTNFRI